MDVVYPLGTGSKWKNNEIRYSLRSLKYINHDKVFIIGDVPNFIHNVIEVKIKDKSTKQESVINKLIKICKREDLSEDFIYMNDDFIFLKKQEIKTYTNKTLNELANKYDPLESQYGVAIRKCREILIKAKKPIKNYEIHYPLIINKTKFLKAVKKAQNTTYRSIYGNYYELPSIETKDFKIYTLNQFKAYKNRQLISLSDRMVRKGKVRSFLRKKFPTKSIFER